MGVQSAAAACLACLAQQPALLVAINRRGAVQRLAPALLSIMAPPQDRPGALLLQSDCPGFSSCHLWDAELYAVTAV